MKAWLSGVCLFQAMLLIVRTAAVLGVITPLWAVALPGYLPAALRMGSDIAPLLLIAVWTAVLGRRTRETVSHPEKWPGGVQLPVLLLPILVLSLPDRAGFMGDFLIRQGAVLANNYGGTFPQSLPLDRWIQGVLVPTLGADSAARPLQGARWMGFLACIATTIIGARAVRSSGIARPWSDLATLILSGGAYVSLFTGIARDTVVFLPVSLLLLASLLGRIRDGARWSCIPELAVTCLLVLHRAAICLLPAYFYATIESARASRSGSPRSRSWWIGATLLGLASVIMIPRIVGLGLAFDLPMNAEWVISRRWEGNPLASPTLLWDVFNAIVMLAPVAPLGLALIGLPGGVERRFCLACVAGWLPVVLLVRPHQGAFRDYDAYAAFALTLSFCAVLGLTSRPAVASRVGQWALVLTAISTVQATMGLLLVSSSATFTEARVRHGIELAKPTQQREKSLMHEYLGVNAEGRGLWKEAASQFGSAAELTPAPVRIVRAGRAAAYANDWAGAQVWFGRLISRDSASVIGWCGHSAASWMVGDTALARLGEDRLTQLSRSQRERFVALRFLSYAPVLDESGRLRRILSPELRP